MKTLLALAGLLVSIPALAVSESGYEPKVGERVATFEMSWARRSSDDVGRLALAVAEVMTGAQLRGAEFAVAPLKASDGAERRWEVRSAGAPDLRIRYLPEQDELRALARELLPATTPLADVGEERAAEIARKAFGRLAEAKVLDLRQFDWKNVEVAATLAGGGSVDGRIAERYLVERRFTLRRAINGIELANAGLRIAVHASGRISGLRLGGVSVSSSLQAGQPESPLGRGQWLSRKVDRTAIERRFAADAVPKGLEARPEVAWSRVMYVMPEGQREAVVEPLQVISYSLQMRTKEGETVVSRRKVLGYSLTDPAAPPIDLVPPTRAPQEGDKSKPGA